MARAKIPTAPVELRLGTDRRGEWFAYHHKIADVAAVQAIAEGRASEDQQKRGMRWIIETLGMAYQDTFNPDSERVSTFVQGRRFVGLKLVAMLRVDVADLKKRQDRNAPPSATGV